MRNSVHISGFIFNVLLLILGVLGGNSIIMLTFIAGSFSSVLLLLSGFFRNMGFDNIGILHVFPILISVIITCLIRL